MQEAEEISSVAYKKKHTSEESRNLIGIYT